MKLNLDPKVKKKLTAAAAVMFVVVMAAWMFLNPGPEHIADTNGADNYKLQSITERDIVKHTMGSRGGLSTGKTSFEIAGITVSNGTKYSCKKFTGVELLYTCTIFKGSDIRVDLANYTIKSGNFAFYIVYDGEVVGKILPDEFGCGTFLMENIKKTASLEYVIAGESANFTFSTMEEWQES